MQTWGFSQVYRKIYRVCRVPNCCLPCSRGPDWVVQEGYQQCGCMRSAHTPWWHLPEAMSSWYNTHVALYTAWVLSMVFFTIEISWQARASYMHHAMMMSHPVNIIAAQPLCGDILCGGIACDGGMPPPSRPLPVVGNHCCKVGDLGLTAGSWEP